MMPARQNAGQNGIIIYDTLNHQGRELNVVDLRQPSEEPLSTTVMQLSVNLARKSCMYVYREFVQPGHV